MDVTILLCMTIYLPMKNYSVKTHKKQRCWVSTVHKSSSSFSHCGLFKTGILG